MLRRFPAVAFVLMHLTLTSWAVAGDSPLSCIPAEAVCILKIREIDNTLQKWEAACDSLEALARQEWVSDVPAEHVAEEQHQWRVMIRELVESNFPVPHSGVDGNQDLWGFFWGDAEADDKVAYGFLIPVDDLSKLQEPLHESEFIHLEALIHDRWVIWANRPALIVIKQCLANEKKSIESRLPAETSLLFASGDLTLYVNLDQLIADNPGSVRDSIEGLHQTLMSCVPTEIQPVQTKEVLLKTIEQFVSFARQTVDDTDSLTLSLTLSDTDLRLEHFQSVKTDSQTAVLFSDHPGTAMTALSGLPPNGVLYFACERLQQTTTDWFTQFCELVQADGRETLSAQFAQIRAGYRQLKYGTFAAAFPVFPLEQGGLRFVTIGEVDKPQVAHDLDVQFANLGEAAGKQKAENNPTVKPMSAIRSTERLGNQSVDVVQQLSAFQVGVNGVPQENNFETAAFGPDGNVTRTVCLQDRIIDCVGGTRARAVAMIRRATEAAQGQEVSEPAFSRTRNQLSSRANLIVMLDLGSAIAAGMQFWNSSLDSHQNPAAAGQAVVMKNLPAEDGELDGPMIADATQVENGDGEVDPAEQPPANAAGEEADDDVGEKIDQSKIDSFRAASAFIGFSIGLEPKGSRTTLVIPRVAIENVVKLSGATKEVWSEFFEGF